MLIFDKGVSSLDTPLQNKVRGLGYIPKPLLAITAATVILVCYLYILINLLNSQIQNVLEELSSGSKLKINISEKNCANT